MKAIKGCTNPRCKECSKQKRFKREIIDCPECGAELSFVCADCWKVLPNGRDKYCTSCEVKRKQRVENAVDTVKTVGKGAVAVLAVGVTVLTNGGKLLDAAADLADKFKK